MKKRELEAFLFFAEIKVRAKKYKNLKNPPSFPVDCLQSEKGHSSPFSLSV
jgi:hypothetical protein